MRSGEDEGPGGEREIERERKGHRAGVQGMRKVEVWGG